MTDLYQTQRTMRRMRRQAMDRGVVAILDMGSSKVTCLILRFNGEIRDRMGAANGALAGQSAFQVIGAATTRARGVQFGEIAAMSETERAIRTAVQAAQKMANVRVDHVIACLSGAQPRSYGLEGVTEIADGVVSEADVAHALAACDVPDFGEGREVLHAQPVNFALDHRSGLLDPRGQIGNRLAVDLHVVTIEADALRNMLYCIKRCDLELAGLASSAYVSALSSLVEDEQELGAACIDMGGGTTGLSIFIKKHMIYADSLRMGGDHVTQDISKLLQVSMATAERIKTFHGGVVATGKDDREMIELGGNTGDYDQDRRTVSRADLIGIIRPRVVEILEDLRERLDAAGFDHLPSQKIVLCGGASQLPGLDGLASHILGRQARLGRPLRVQGLPQVAMGPGFAGLVGLCLFAANPQDEWWDFDIPAERYPARSLRRAFKWFADNW